MLGAAQMKETSDFVDKTTLVASESTESAENIERPLASKTPPTMQGRKCQDGDSLVALLEVDDKTVQLIDGQQGLSTAESSFHPLPQI